MSHDGILKRLAGLKPRLGVEVGCGDGSLSAKLLGAFTKLQMTGIDAYGPLPDQERYRASGDACARLTQKDHDTRQKLAIKRVANRGGVTKGLSMEVAAKAGDQRFDFVVIDAEHTYEAVLCDLKAWFPKLKEGGLLVGPCAGHPRDKKGFWGVERAVRDFAKMHGLEVTITADQVWSICNRSTR